MACFVYALLLLSMVAHSSATWCVCKDGSDATLQKTLDYACGAGADCNPTHEKGSCFQPNTVRAHCSYAVNSYFQKNRQAVGSCDFSGTATVVSSDPSVTGCSFPSSASATPSTTNGPPSSTTVGGNNPMVTNSSPGVLGGGGGGVNTGLGPSGVGYDENDGGFSQQKKSVDVTFLTLVVSGFVFWWV